MKLFAARNRDFDDAVRLSTETDITSAETMLQLIDDAYYHNVIPAEIEDFINDVARAVAERDPLETHRNIPARRPSRHDGGLSL